jgi:hypothetical protein
MHKDYQFGVNVSLNHIKPQQLPSLIQKIDDLGCGYIRLEFDWYSIFDYTLHDQFIQAMHKRRIRILGLLTGLVHGTIYNLIFLRLHYTPVTKNKEGFLSFVKKICTQYHHYIKHWEIWNEQNTRRFWILQPSPKAYVTLLESTIHTIRQIDKKAQIIAGGLMGNDKEKILFARTGFIPQIKQSPCNKNITAYAFHPYTLSCYFSLSKNKTSYLADFKKNIDLIQASFATPCKEIWITEYGISSKHTHSLTDEDIGWIYSQALLYAKKKHMKLFLWTIIDIQQKHYNWLNPERYFGIITKDFEEKKSYKKLASHRQHI